ncbi:MAG: Holliday junction resolvase RuvX [Candidatus Phytoplasma stylosanthis]|uniref:Holliday junction resolvase RuvX n=1 Tax=Candidatus Phytoplasma stylosanthis TaxID=2798314 RepID=UPI00293AF212|nr:Holliday junction resolvase RuvX [Candidatus Phytoplasma stylosanthis]MDV3167948.1 Holliday junction resolvase RuvX [Candidatus Phytoplasma stylosanthis]MDV3171041.1 Holliday junction resolvase RuvX [Candidatus Phytoplasma stylosanthis]MDV3173629.1 Holliday junction resolvase RuvX [Candidatus Phytoplasma stylosanthis]MDV3174237.1 Holliday junction resolvase RuvX [Candidatus Phytoplasma stylosanthis]MDV3202706.1 Holliday junction resolvase RuvX [Candidatus Phytoplasma stylosanthis]
MIKKNVFLGLDLGEKTLGISISESGIIVNNLKTIFFNANQYQELIKPLTKIIQEFKVNKVVLGYPKHMNNDIGIKAQISIDFFKMIKKNFFYLEVILWDERLSTKQAYYFLRFNNFKKKKIKKIKDQMAASIILQNFLNYYNNTLVNGKRLNEK